MYWMCNCTLVWFLAMLLNRNREGEGKQTGKTQPHAPYMYVSFKLNKT